MHGIIFDQLREFANARLGARGWERLTAEAKLGNRMYLAFNAYPDPEMVQLLEAACRLTGLSTQAVLEDFGQFIVPGLVKTYRVHFRPEWTLFDFVEHIERIHDKVRSDRNATPPKLFTHREGPQQVRVTYRSERKLCALGVGFIKGLSHAMKQPVTVRELQCMHRGADSCELQVSASA